MRCMLVIICIRGRMLEANVAVVHEKFKERFLISREYTGSGMGTCAEAARRRVHLVTVLLPPPSGHRPGRRQPRHAHILQIELHLTQL